MTSDDSAWRRELKTVVDLMREISCQTEPQMAANLYGKRLREGKLVPSDGWISVSRRGLAAPFYRVTRSTLWKRDVDPWAEKDQLPIYTSGLLGELLYGNEPVVICDLKSRLSADDPALEHFQNMNMLLTLPHYDDGVALNMSVVLVRDPASFPMDRIPMMVWQSNLWGRSILSLVLRKELKGAYDQLDRELQHVGEIQRSLLPAQLPVIAGLDLAASYHTSQRAGGDYYDLFDLGDGRWGFLIADVSGHGPPAAVIMAITHAIAHLHPTTGMPCDLLSFVNRSLVERYTSGNGTFVTAFYGVYDSRTRKLTYARAGHNPPRLLRGGVAYELDKVGGVPLGLFADSVYEEREETLHPSDALLFYTDGVTDARNNAGDMFGTELLDAALAKSRDGAKSLLENVLGALKEFAGGTLAADDQTLLAVVVKEKS